MKTIDYSTWVGQRVFKYRKTRTPKPFKSGHQVNTVKGITVNPNTQKVAFIFEEDDSIVDAHICQVETK